MCSDHPALLGERSGSSRASFARKGVGTRPALVTRHLPHLLLALLLMLAALWRGPEAVAADGTWLRFDPAFATIGADEILEVRVLIENVWRLYGIDLQITFDPAVVQVEDLLQSIPGIQVAPGAFPYPDWPIRNQADNLAGTIHYAVTQLPPTAPRNGSGRVCTVRLRGRFPGTTTIAFAAVRLSDQDGLDMDRETLNAQVMVREAGTSTATATRTPTPTVTAQPPTATPTGTATPTATFTPEAATPTPTSTTEPTATSTAEPPTATPTGTGQPTATFTPEAATATPTSTGQPTPTATVEATATIPPATATPTITPGGPTVPPPTPSLFLPLVLTNTRLKVVP
ncbi:MAG: hypothetical protein FJZ90_13960 [Chloroflexi bacterium]|nr:hypothetical protein [Chloroflexota bacterium]